jgi:hypothetical protein
MTVNVIPVSNSGVSMPTMSTVLGFKGNGLPGSGNRRFFCPPARLKTSCFLLRADLHGRRSLARDQGQKRFYPHRQFRMRPPAFV